MDNNPWVYFLHWKIKNTFLFRETDMSTCPLNPEENKDVKDIKQLTCYDLMKEQVMP